MQETVYKVLLYNAASSRGISDLQELCKQMSSVWGNIWGFLYICHAYVTLSTILALVHHVTNTCVSQIRDTFISQPRLSQYIFHSRTNYSSF